MSARRPLVTTLVVSGLTLLAHPVTAQLGTPDRAGFGTRVETDDPVEDVRFLLTGQSFLLRRGELFERLSGPRGFALSVIGTAGEKWDLEAGFAHVRSDDGLDPSPATEWSVGLGFARILSASGVRLSAGPHFTATRFTRGFYFSGTWGATAMLRANVEWRAFDDVSLLLRGGFGYASTFGYPGLDAESPGQTRKEDPTSSMVGRRIALEVGVAWRPWGR